MSTTFLEAFPDILNTKQPRERKMARRFQASIIDRQGKEQPITEQMILQACKNLENQRMMAELNPGKSPKR